MGLATTHDCWRGSYSSFGAWRNAVAVAAGFALERHPTAHVLLPVLDWDVYQGGEYEGVWPAPPADPLLYLIVHSDCDGELPVEALLPLANRLEGLLPKIQGSHIEGPHDGMFGPATMTHVCDPFPEQTRRFIDGLRRAAAAGEAVRFH